MAISKRTNRAGRVIGYTVVAVIPNPLGGRGARHVVGTYRTRRLAEDAERRAKDAIQAGTFQPVPVEPARVLTVRDVVDVWFAAKQPTVQPNTANGYESAIRLHLLPALGSMPVADLSRTGIRQQLRSWQAGGMGAQLQHRCVMVLSAALAEAVEDGTIPFNPAERIKKPSVKKKIDVPRWEPRQLAAFLDEAEHDQLFPFWHLTLLEGMRRAEALGLRWRDLHWNEDETGAVANIVQTVVPDLGNGGKALIQQRAKTDASRRAVMLTDTTVAALKRHRDRQKFQQQQWAEVWGDHDLIVTTALGQVVNPSTVKGNRNRLMERAGVPFATTHGLRHMAATLMLQAGTSPALVASKIGHKDIGLTVNTYGHIKAQDHSSANAAVEAYLARANRNGTDE